MADCTKISSCENDSTDLADFFFQLRSLFGLNEIFICKIF